MAMNEVHSTEEEREEAKESKASKIIIWSVVALIIGWVAAFEWMAIEAIL
jgi:hypothetical protein